MCRKTNPSKARAAATASAANRIHAVGAASTSVSDVASKQSKSFIWRRDQDPAERFAERQREESMKRRRQTPFASPRPSDGEDDDNVDSEELNQIMEQNREREARKLESQRRE